MQFRPVDRFRRRFRHIDGELRCRATRQNNNRMAQNGAKPNETVHRHHNEMARFIAAKTATKLSSTVTKRLGVHVEKREMAVSLSAGKSAATAAEEFLVLHLITILLHVVAQIRGS